MACGAVEVAVVMAVVRRMLCADGIIRTELKSCERVVEKTIDAVRHTAQTAQGTLSSGGGSVYQQTKARRLGCAAGIDTLFQRRKRIATFQGMNSPAFSRRLLSSFPAAVRTQRVTASGF
jgi:hypothetical protein